MRASQENILSFKVTMEDVAFTKIIKLNLEPVLFSFNLSIPSLLEKLKTKLNDLKFNRKIVITYKRKKNL